MNLDRIKYFVVLAEQLHFGRAADMLYISQSTLSYNISELEKELNATLFIRNNRKVLLSSVGVALLPAAKELIDCSERLEQLVHNNKTKKREVDHLKLGLDSAFCRVDLLGFPAALQKLQAEHPRLKTDISFRHYYDLLRATEEMTVDISFGYMRSDDKISNFLNVLPLFEDEFVIVHNFPDAGGKTAEELLGEYVLYLRRDDPRWTDYIINYLSGNGFSFRHILADTFTEIFTCVRLGSGIYITNLSDVGVAGDTRNQGFNIVHFEDRILNATLCAFWAKGNYNYAIMELLSDLDIDPHLESLSW